jgi:hypothetical protein
MMRIMTGAMRMKNNKQKFISMLDDEDNPCNKCLIKAVCRKLFMDDSACNDFWEYTYSRIRGQKNVKEDV